MRRQYFINRKFQAGFILKILLVLIVGAILSVGVTMLTTQATLTSSFDGSRLVIEKTSLAILPSVILTHLISTLVVGVNVFIISLLVSHKVAGPMYRFEKDLEEISQGNLIKQIHIRSGDQFDSVARNLNQMVKNLNEKLREAQCDLERIAGVAETQNLPQAFKESLEECLRNINSNFKL